MGETFSLVCHETRKRVWIGQGWERMLNFYGGDKVTMDALKRFLNEHIGKSLEFLCDDTNEQILGYDDYGPPMGSA